ncbi:hypothetical protein C3747_140g27 [Trypanosoma cruzi]|uniref:Opioid growth factor receptor (OGFr) conserved domain-containing protein n=2 Tax=Trypanosoma cruzi TaxID=5693 RepID=Q4D4Z5_TRYCC|nr:hypothetical protein, conserved [Trypanosoma cruzi]EAN87591.1 hypothetical protein, conserved [Trypanosoma cruzi]KAF5222282.1 hypothetical protein ECC02_004563 [Trypanosoma cruzi]PWV04995.1 hypothetical protein C3747_140g27 [Trypanosoma cruzi]|eukprot:XP_809442.1 hypothetical protein [Trypanosoma cruzi strain CL Brener]
MGKVQESQKECPELSLQSTPDLGGDLEAHLARLRESADEVAAAGGDFREHPSVSFYRGSRPVQVRLPPQKEGETQNVTSCLHVIALHQALLPPCRDGTSFSEEEQSARLSSSDGLELLQLNWNRLLWLLMPSVRLGTRTEGCTLTEADQISVKKNEEFTKYSLISYCEIFQALTWKDYKQLRHPSMMDRVHYSYVVFLRFYGWRLYDEESGILDRHRNWRARYKMLVPRSDVHDGSVSGSEVTIGFYGALSRILCVLLELCLTRYAVNLIAFLLEEMHKGRLLFLQSKLERSWLPQILHSKQVAESEKERLRRQLYRLVHSDSD